MPGGTCSQLSNRLYNFKVTMCIRDGLRENMHQGWILSNLFSSFLFFFFVGFDYSVCVSRSVVSNSLRLHGLQPTRLLCPWDSPGKNTGVGCHALLQGTFPTLGSNPGLLHCRWILYHLSHQGSYSLGKRKHEISSTHLTPARMTYFRITSPSFLKFKKKNGIFLSSLSFYSGYSPSDSVDLKQW